MFQTLSLLGSCVTPPLANKPVTPSYRQRQQRRKQSRGRLSLCSRRARITRVHLSLSHAPLSRRERARLSDAVRLGSDSCEESLPDVSQLLSAACIARITILSQLSTLRGTLPARRQSLRSATYSVGVRGSFIRETRSRDKGAAGRPSRSQSDFHHFHCRRIVTRPVSAWSAEHSSSTAS